MNTLTTATQTSANSPNKTQLSLSKQGLSYALQTYLEKRKVEVKATETDDQVALPTKYMFGINVTHQPTSNKKTKLARAGLAKLNDIDTVKELGILVQAILAEDIKIEYEKDLANKQAGMASISVGSVDATLVETNYESLLVNYLEVNKSLRLDLLTHPHPYKSNLFKVIRPFLDGIPPNCIVLAPHAKKCAAIIDGFRRAFKIVESERKFKSKFADPKYAQDLHQNDIIVTTYELLIEVSNQTPERFREILCNAFGLERILIFQQGAFFPNYTIREENSILNFVNGSNSTSTTDLKVFLAMSHGKLDLNNVKTPNDRRLFSGMTELEAFVRKTVKDLDRSISANTQSVQAPTLQSS